MAKTNREIIEMLCKEVFNGHSFKMLDQYMRDDYIQHNQDVPQGKAGFKEFFTNTFKSIPDFGYTIKRIVAEGDYVMLYARTTGTHTGGPWINHPPTEIRSISMRLISSAFRTGKLPNTGMWQIPSIFSGKSAS